MVRNRFLAWVCCAAACAAILLPFAAAAYDPFLETPDAAAVDAAPAYRHANLSGQAALDELRSRGVLFQEQPPARGVDAPIRLTSRLHGVHIHSSLPESARPITPFEICDARLALALDDFAAILERHDIDEVVHFSMYRPGVPPQPARRILPPGLVPSSSGLLPVLPPPDQDGLGPIGLPASARPPSARAPIAAVRASGRPRSGAAIPPRTAPAATPSGSAAQPRVVPPSRHPAGLAIDVALLHKKSGEWLNVASHFSGRIGARTCGAGAAVPTDAKAREMQAIVCEVSDARVFTYVLTPNYNLAHRDHFHMEVKPGVRWFLVH